MESNIKMRRIIAVSDMKLSDGRGLRDGEIELYRWEGIEKEL